MGEKVTIMVLKVNDLRCPCCYKKVKKVLCKFPEIRDQVYDEKGNTVTITVVCCSPEKIRDQICCKGCGVIKSIEIKEPKKPENPKKPKKVTFEEPKSPDKPEAVIIETPPEKPPPSAVEKPKESEKPKEVPKPDQTKAPDPIPVPNPWPPGIPARTCCGECYEGRGGGPCYYYGGYGVPPPPPPHPPSYYDGYYYGYGGRGCNFSRCDYYFSEENPHSCHIM